MSEIRSTRHVIKSDRPGGSPTGDPARMQPPDSFQVNEDSTRGSFDIDKLEAELDVAISAEMGVPDEGNETSVSDDSEASVAMIGSSDVDTASEEATGSKRVESAPRGEARVSMEDDGPEFMDLLLKPCTAPVERLGSKGRFLLNFLAVSLALWAPIVWWGAMTDGFGFLNRIGGADSVPTTTVVEPGTGSFDTR